MNREAFFARANSPKVKDVTLDNGGDVVKVRKLTQREVETIRKQYADDTAALEGFRFVVSRCVVNDQGERVFTDEDQAKLVELDFDVLQQLASEITEFSGLKVDAKKP